jgi:acetoin utilization deacetylase AcuC-like enzyme
MATPLFYHPDQDVVFDWISTKKIPEFVRQSDRRYYIPTPLTVDQIAVAHDPRFVRSVMDGSRENGFGNRNPEINRSLLASNGSFLAAAEYAVQHGGVACSASQGFHHAHWDHCYGYCTFNGLMVAAVHLLERYATDIERVMIVDGDGHYGDGTDDIIRQMNLGYYVRHITRADLGHRRLVEASATKWKSYFEDLIQDHKPGIIMYQAGADAWDQDPYGVGYLSVKGLMRRDSGMFEAAKAAGIPLVWNLAGGYSDPMQKTIDIHLNTLSMSDRVYNATST